MAKRPTPRECQPCTACCDGWQAQLEAGLREHERANLDSAKNAYQQALALEGLRKDLHQAAC